MKEENKKTILRFVIFAVFIMLIPLGISDEATMEKPELLMLYYGILMAYSVLISAIILNEIILILFKQKELRYGTEIRFSLVLLYSVIMIRSLSEHLINVAQSDAEPFIKWAVVVVESNYQTIPFIMLLLYIFVWYKTEIRNRRSEDTPDIGLEEREAKDPTQ